LKPGPASTDSAADERTFASSQTITALAVSLVYFAVAACLLPDYGPVWDSFELTYGPRILEYLATGEPTFLEFGGESSLTVRDPHPDFGSRNHWYQNYPLGVTLSALSCRILWTWLGLVPAMAAHHLVVPLFVAGLLFVVTRFVARRFGIATGVAASLFLILSPRFFAHSFNNFKDIPEACLYSLALIAAYRAMSGPGVRWWVWAGSCTALALAQKANAMFIPVQMVLFLLAIRGFPALRNDSEPRHLRGIAIGSITFLAVYFVVSPPLWEDTFARLATHLGETLRVGTTVFSGVTGPGGFTLHGPVHVLITTPPAVLLLGAIGAAAPGCKARLRVFFLLWLLVPMIRVALPGMRNFDGVRHFLEFYPALALLAALGLRACIRGMTVLAQATPRARRAWQTGVVVLPTVALLSCTIVTVRTHPNGICYFNSIVGGLEGAQDAGIPEATDYWGNSYWQGVGWLNEHAEDGTCLLVPLAPEVVECARRVRLRPDIKLQRDDLPDPAAPLYVMYITRKSWYGPLIHELERSGGNVAHEVRVQGGVILRIHRFGEAALAAWVRELWQRQRRANAAEDRLMAWASKDTENRLAVATRILWEIPIVGVEESQRRLRALLPDELHEMIPDITWARSASARNR
jgi:hypothetical protein